MPLKSEQPRSCFTDDVQTFYISVLIFQNLELQLTSLTMPRGKQQIWWPPDGGWLLSCNQQDTKTRVPSQLLQLLGGF